MTMMRATFAIVYVCMLASLPSADAIREKGLRLRTRLKADPPDLKPLLHSEGVSFLQEEVLLNSQSMNLLSEHSTSLSPRATLFSNTTLVFMPLLVVVPALCSMLLQALVLLRDAKEPTENAKEPTDGKVAEEEEPSSVEEPIEIDLESDQEIDQPDGDTPEPLAMQTQPHEGEVVNSAITPKLQTNLSEGELLIFKRIRELQVYHDIVPPRHCYDCNIVWPEEDALPVRLQGVVLAPCQSVHAPIADRECVLYSTSASECRLDGVRSPPIAFHSTSSDFELELLGTDSCTKVRIQGDRVALFGMVGGKEFRQSMLQDAPEALQNFVRTHKTPRVPKATKVAGGSAVLEFTESSLNIGATVTCVGKLNRKPTGELELMPNDCHGLGSVIIEKVLVSDNPNLLN